MSQNRIITEYVNERFWDNGDSSLSFKLDAYVKKQLLEAPDNVFVTIKRSSKEGKGSHFMSYKVQQ